MSTSGSNLLQGTLYWQEIRKGLFVHNEEWDTTIERLPDLISADFVLSKLQTIDQLFASGFRGIGTVGKSCIEVTPDYEVLRESLIEGAFQPENLFLQWLYRFYLIESVTAHFHNTPLPELNPTYVTILDENLHLMTYISSLIFLYEDGELKDVVTRDNFHSTEIMVKNKVKDLTSTLYSKCAEYGESFRRHGVQGTLPRLWDKIARYAQLSALGRDAKYEPKRDSAKDLLGYCIIAWSLIHELDEV